MKYYPDFQELPLSNFNLLKSCETETIEGKQSHHCTNVCRGILCQHLFSNRECTVQVSCHYMYMSFQIMIHLLFMPSLISESYLAGSMIWSFVYIVTSVM